MDFLMKYISIYDFLTYFVHLSLYQSSNCISHIHQLDLIQYNHPITNFLLLDNNHHHPYLHPIPPIHYTNHHYILIIHQYLNYFQYDV
jgi:hypothetical protein